MARATIKTTIDFSDLGQKKKLLSQIGTLNGFYEIEIQPRRKLRSHEANRYYWGFVVAPFAEFLSEQDVCRVSSEEAHVILKVKILGPVVIANPLTGEVVGEVPANTHDMTTAQFHDYVERCRVWLADFFGIITLDPNEQAAAV